jgi:hypothetical protein
VISGAELPATLDLSELVEALHAAGFRTDVRQYLAANEILLALAACRKPIDRISTESDCDEVANHLGPIFSTSPQELVLFAEVLRRWLNVRPILPSLLGKRPRHKWLLIMVLFGAAAIVTTLTAYWFTPVQLEGIVHRTRLDGQGEVAAPEASVLFRGEPVANSAEGIFTFQMRRQDPEAPLEVELSGYSLEKLMVTARTQSPIQVSLTVITSGSWDASWIVIGEPKLLMYPASHIITTEVPNVVLAIIVAVVTVVLTLLGLIAFGQARRALVLRRMPIAAADFSSMPLTETKPPLGFEEKQARRVASQLRRPREQSTAALDIDRTVKATARVAGIFSPVFVPRLQQPEYLSLVERISKDDHLWRLVSGWIDQLVQQDVHIEHYWFYEDPRVCQGPTQPPRSYRLEQLAANHHHCTLFLFVPTSACFDPVSGTLAGWTRLLENWPRRVLFTPEPAYRWTRREWKLADTGLILLPAGPAGLEMYGEIRFEWQIERLFPTSYARAFPTAINSSLRHWLDRNNPPIETVEALLRQLKGFLGPQGFSWLCACAVYPEIHWPLTLSIGNMLNQQDGVSADNNLVQQNLPSLARLPWFREGYMPDWLRLALISQLRPDLEVILRKHLAQLLADAAASKLTSAPPDLDLSGLRIAGWTLSEASLLTAPPDSPARDSIFIGFLAGAHMDSLALRIPAALRRFFKRIRGLPLFLEKKKLAYTPSLIERVKTWLRAMRIMRPRLLQSAVAGLMGLVVLLAVLRATTRPLAAPSAESMIESASFSRDSQRIVTASSDHTARVWDTATVKELIRFAEHKEAVLSAVFSPDGTMIASGSRDETVRIWDSKQGTRSITLRGHGSSVNSVAFSTDGRFVLSGSDDQTARLWDAATGLEVRRFEGHSGKITSVAFSSDGRFVLSGSDDKTIRLWNTANGLEVQRFEGHSGKITSVAFSPDGRFALSGSDDKTTRLWNLTVIEKVTLPMMQEPSRSVAFSEDGKTIASAASDRIFLWPTTTPPARAAAHTSLTDMSTQQSLPGSQAPPTTVTTETPSAPTNLRLK